MQQTPPGISEYFWLLQHLVIEGGAAGCPPGVLTCWVVAKQYSAVLRMLQMRQSSSKVNLATSEPSFSFSKLVMVSPPLLLVVLEKEIYKKDKTRKACGCADTHIAELPQGFNAIKSPDDHKVQRAVQHGSAPLYIKPQLLLLLRNIF